MRHDGIAMISMGNITVEQETNPNNDWLIRKCPMNIDVSALATYGNVSYVEPTDRFLVNNFTDIESPDMSIWGSVSVGSVKTWSVGPSAKVVSYSDVTPASNPLWS